MPTFQEQFQQYLSNSYYPNNPPLNQGGEPNIVEPINTFDISPELKKKLKKERKTISPIRQYANDTLQFDETTGTGQFDFSDPFKLFNIAAQGITGFANANNDAKNRRLEEQMYLQSLIPKPSFNYNEDGLNNIPMYKGGGQNPAKVYTDRKQFEQAQQAYSDSLDVYNLGEEAFQKIRKTGRTNLGGGMDVNLSSEKTIPYENFINEYNSGKPKFGVFNTGTNKTMYPEKISRFNGAGFFGFLDYSNQGRFKQPVQPVVYQGTQNLPTKVLSSIPQKAKPTHPVQKMVRINPQQMDLSSQVNIQGQPIQMPAFQFPQQKGNPVYGPGNTIVGYSDNMNFSPAYQYTGAPNNQLNLQDKELLNNPEALRKYVIGKDNYKFKTEEYKSGGGNPFVEGSVHDISEEEIKQLIKKGFKIKYL
jgi:hypothetical protein